MKEGQEATVMVYGSNLTVVVAALLLSTAALAAPGDEGCSDGPNALSGIAEVVTKPVNPSCKADGFSKTYPGPNGAQGVRNWLGRRVVDVACKYRCTSENLPTVIIEGTRTVSFWSENGTELACSHIPYEQRYNNYKGWFVYVPMEPKWFHPKKSDVRELNDWIQGKKVKTEPAPAQ